MRWLSRGKLAVFAAGFCTLAALGLAPAGSANPTPAPTQPSNEFKVLGLEGKTLRLELASAGTVRITEATSVKTLSSASGQGQGLLPTEPKWLKPISASGGPGEIKLNLKLTAAGNKRLQEAGKVRVWARIAFTPTGGTTATQTKRLTVKKPKPGKAKGGK